MKNLCSSGQLPVPSATSMSALMESLPINISSLPAPPLSLIKVSSRTRGSELGIYQCRGSKNILAWLGDKGRSSLCLHALERRLAWETEIWALTAMHYTSGLQSPLRANWLALASLFWVNVKIKNQGSSHVLPQGYENCGSARECGGDDGLL